MAKKKKIMEELLEEALVPEEEQPYEVPENWVWVKMGNAMEINPKKPKLEIPNEQVCSFLPMGLVNPEFGIITSIEERTFEKVKKGYTYFKENDILFAKITPCMENGNTVIAKGLKNRFGFGSTEFYVIRTSEQVDERYVYHLLRSQLFRKQAKEKMTGAVGQQRVPKSYMEEYPFPLPPLNEQKRIADKVERLLSKIDEAKQLIDEAKESFELRRAALLDKAFRGELTREWRSRNPFEGLVNQQLVKNKNIDIKEIKNVPHELPNGWEWIELKDLLTDKGIFDGPFGSNLKTADYTKSGVRVIRLENIGRLSFDDTKRTYISEEKYASLEKHTLTEGDIIFASFISDNIRVCMIPSMDTKAINKADCFCIRPNIEKINKEFLLYFLSSNICYKFFHSQIHGATRPRINTSQLKTLPIPVPPLKEQVEMVKCIHKLFRAEQNALDNLDVEALIFEIKQSFLSKAYQGKLETNSPVEENAIELLKQILQEEQIR